MTASALGATLIKLAYLLLQRCRLALLEGQPKHHRALFASMLSELSLHAPFRRAKLVQVRLDGLALGRGHGAVVHRVATMRHER